ncbi:MAG: flagellar hook-length control protein FliK [Planctomycetaceae bacterium]|nr:flagellar hook-length control protein FliK [Planctomycetaceae bacterium]
MAGNDISKLLQIALSPENLRPQTPDAVRFDPFELNSGESFYQNALKKSREIENRRASSPPTEPVSRESYEPEPDTSRAEDSSPLRRDRFAREDRDTSRPEPALRERPTRNRTETEFNNTRNSNANQETVNESSNDNGQPEQVVNSSSVADSGVAQSAPSPETSETASETLSETNSEIEQVELSESISESLAVLNEVVSQLLQKSSETDSSFKPPASFGKEFLKQIQGTQSGEQPEVTHPFFESDPEGKLQIPGQLLLGLIAQKVGQQAQAEGTNSPIDPSNIAATIQEVVAGLVTPVENGNPHAPLNTGEDAGQELVNQIVEAFAGETEAIGQTVLQNTEASPALQADGSGDAPVETPETNLNPVGINPVASGPGSENILTPGILSDTHEEPATNNEDGQVRSSSTNQQFNANTELANQVTTEIVQTDTDTENSEQLPTRAENTQGIGVASDSVNPNSNQDKSSSEESKTTPQGKVEPEPNGNGRRAEKTKTSSETTENINEGEPVQQTNRNRPEGTRDNKVTVPVASGLDVAATKAAVDGLKTANAETQPVVNAIEGAPASRSVAVDRAAGRPSGISTTLPAVQSHEFLERLSESVRVADKNHQQLKVRLTPPQLGSMSIEVTRQEGVVMARLEVQSTAAQQLLLDQIAGLKETLQQQGHLVERIEVTLQDPGRPDQSSQHKSQQDQDQDQERRQQPRQQQQDHSSQRDEGGEDEGNEKPTRSSHWSMDNIDVEI